MSTAIASQHNPYIIGRPIHEKAEFFGRDDLFRFIADNLNQQSQVILLHGQRRIGKSSVLAQIPNFVELDDFEFVSLSLEGQANKELGDLLSELARDIVDQLEHSDALVKPIKAPAKSAFKKDIAAFSETFLPKIYAALGDKNLVLLLDEFDVLEDHSPESAVEQFFPYLQSILKRHPRLYLVPVVGRRLDELPNLLNLFGRAPYQEVGLLQGKWARDLVTKPAAGMLNYAPEAIDAVLELTAGHPYLTQVLCFAVFVHLREEERRDVTRADVEGSVDKAIELGQAGLTWFRDGLPIAERVMLSAVAAAQSIEESTSSHKHPLDLLEEHGVVITDELQQSLEHIYEWGFVNANLTRNYFQISIELVCIWLRNKYLLQNETRELENISEEANNIYAEIGINQQYIEELQKKQALLRLKSDKLKRLAKQGKAISSSGFSENQALIQTEIEDSADKMQKNENSIREAREKNIEKRIYQEVLEVNPNHFSALFRIAEISLEEYLRANEEEQSYLSAGVMKMHERIHKVDPVKSKPGFIRFLLIFGKTQIIEGDFHYAQKIFEKIASIDCGNRDVRILLELVKKQYILDGKVFSFIRCLKKVFEINDYEEEIIQSTIERWRTKMLGIRHYEEVVNSKIDDGRSLESVKPDFFSDLRPIQAEYGLTNADVDPIHEKIRILVERRKKSARIQYHKEVDRLASEGQLSPVAKRILARQSEELGISVKEAYEIEKQVLAPYRDIQEYGQAFKEACNENYPLSEGIRNELKELQKILNLSWEKTEEIEAKILKDFDELASEMRELLRTIRIDNDGWSVREQTPHASRMLEKIERDASLKEKLIKTLTGGGSAALEATIDDPVVKTVLAAVRGWM
jgi:AAA ATPase domain